MFCNIFDFETVAIPKIIIAQIHNDKKNKALRIFFKNRIVRKQMTLVQFINLGPLSHPCETRKDSHAL